MSGLTGALLVGAREEDDITGPLVEYLWSDLKARRNALSLWPEDLAPLYGMELTRYRTYESGARDLLGAGQGLVDELIAMEAFVGKETDRLVDEAPAAGSVVLQATADQSEFTTLHPHACTHRHRNAWPVSLQHVAVGRAAGVLRRAGRDVQVYRAERHFDLTAGRLAVGLGKTETAHLLGLNVKSYYSAERGKTPPRQGSLGDLHDLDDFIAAAATKFEVSVEDGVNVICVLDDQAQFEKLYPHARFGRSDTPYPVRMLHVAAGRCAGSLGRAGATAHIAVVDQM